MKHLVLNIYANGEYVFEYVLNCDLKAYIEYNLCRRSKGL